MKKAPFKVFFYGFERSEKPILSYLDTYRNNKFFFTRLFTPLKPLWLMDL